MIHRDIGRNVIADGHNKARIFPADIHAPFHFPADILLASEGKDAAVCVADKAMRFAEPFCYVFHVCRRLHYKSVYAACGNIICKLRIGSVGGI